MRAGFEPRPRFFFDELPVRSGDIRKTATVPVRRIRAERCLPAAAHPCAERVVALACLQPHHFVISTECDEVPCGSPFQQPVQNGPRVWAAIDVIAESDEDIVRLERNKFSQGAERVEAAMNIANRKTAQAPRSRVESLTQKRAYRSAQIDAVRSFQPVVEFGLRVDP